MDKKNLKKVTPDGKVKLSLNIPQKLMQEIIDDCDANKLTRTSWLTLAIMERLANRKKKNEINN